MDLSAFIIAQSTAHPALASIIMVLGITRAIFKPLMGLVEAFVLATPSASDDQVVKAFEGSKLYAFFVWLIDYTASIKLPKQAAPKPMADAIDISKSA